MKKSRISRAPRTKTTFREERRNDAVNTRKCLDPLCTRRCIVVLCRAKVPSYNRATHTSQSEASCANLRLGLAAISAHFPQNRAKCHWRSSCLARPHHETHTLHGLTPRWTLFGPHARLRSLRRDSQRSTRSERFGTRGPFRVRRTLDVRRRLRAHRFQRLQCGHWRTRLLRKRMGERHERDTAIERSAWTWQLAGRSNHVFPGRWSRSGTTTNT